MVPARHGGAGYRITGAVLGPDDRRALDLHRGKQRLGGLSAARRRRADAGERVHADAGLSPARRRRALGAAGAVGEGERTAGGVPGAAEVAGSVANHLDPGVTPLPKDVRRAALDLYR